MLPMRLILLALFTLVEVASAAFVAPDDGPVPFRRDRLPVDVSTMIKLSRQLIVLAGQVSPEDAEGRRTLAQMMALSLALEPSNNQVGDLLERLSNGGEIPRSAKRDVELAQAHAWDLLGWLEQPEAGDDGQALGACLSDVLVHSDPSHPLSEERADEGDRGKWGGWVAALDAFRDGESTPTPVPEAPSGDVAKLQLREVAVRMPIRYWNRDRRGWVIEAAEFELKAWINEDGEGFVLQLPGEDWEAARERSNLELTDFLKARYGKLPQGLCMRIRLSENGSFDYSRDSKALTALIPVMANAVFSGMAPEGAILAALDEKGRLVGPNRSWQTLRGLANGKQDGGRLVVPESMKEDLLPLLTLEKADFFFRYEVLLAKDFEELLTLSSSQPGQNVVEAAKAFQVVKEAKESRSLGSFVAHPSTQQRLGQIVTRCPAHASAVLLGLRGTSGWPKRLSGKFYAKEVRAALKPMGIVLKGRWNSLKTRSLLEAAAACRENLGEVEKMYGSMAEKAAIYDPASITVKALPGLVGDIKRLDEDDQWRKSSLVKKTYLRYVDAVTRLTEIAGDADEYRLPPRERQD